MKKAFKCLVISILAMMLLSILGSCATTPTTTKATTVTVTDMANRTVVIPIGVHKIATVYGGATNLLISAGASKLMAAMNGASDFAKLVDPNLANVGFVGKGKVDYEALAKLQPDLFVHKANDLETLEAVQKMGIPAIGIYLENQKDIKTSLTLVGEACGLQKEVAAKIKYYDDMMNYAASLVKDVKEANKPNAIVMGSDIGKVADGKMLQSYMMLTAGAINPAKDVVTTNIWPAVGVEEIFKWNPDYIFVTGSSSNTYSVDDLKKDSAWSAVEAVKNGHVYVVPSKLDSWEFPGVGSALGTLWMVKTMYPNLLSDTKFDQKVVEFYKNMYGIDVNATILGY
jgi:ABC-type Fe3+-hydroxamate transport system substrate-binding protein